MSVINETASSTDIQEAQDILRRAYPVARLHEPQAPFSFRQSLRGDDRAVLARFEIGSWTEVHVDFTGTIAFGGLIGGDYRARSLDEELDTSSPFLFRPGMGSSVSVGLDLEMVNLDERALARFAGSWRGMENARLRVGGTAPHSPAAAASWMRTVDYVRGVFDLDDALSNDLIRSTAVEMLFAAALTSFPIEVLGVPNGQVDGDVLPSVVRRALAYIDEHLGEPISVADLAEAASVSVRGIQSAFRRHLDTTPVAAIRAARLSAVHADLVAANPQGTDVASVARRWGFTHLGRFAADYRAEFGELPSKTLHR